MLLLTPTFKKLSASVMLMAAMTMPQNAVAGHAAAGDAASVQAQAAVKEAAHSPPVRIHFCSTANRLL